jgi:hypothetical protein
VPSGSALLVTSLRPSLGETYSAARFASGLREDGWRVEFLASDFAAGFLRQQDLSLTVFEQSGNDNRELLWRRAAAAKPSLVMTADWFLFDAGAGATSGRPGTNEGGSGSGSAPVFDPRWLLDLDCPVTTLDHMGFHPGRRTLVTGFAERLARLRGLSPPAREGAPRPETTIRDLPREVAAVVRPCPPHPARPASDENCYKFSVNEGSPRSDGEMRRAREGLGLAAGEKLVVVPVGTWAVALCTDLGIPYERFFPRLLVEYLAGSPWPVRVVLLGGQGQARHEVQGSVAVESRARASFGEAQELLMAADLVVADNATSSFLGRAVVEGVPTAVLTSSLTVERESGGPRFVAPFRLSEPVRRLLCDIEAEAPGSLFPFLLYPLGWRDELAPVFKDTSYGAALQWLELFDEEGTTRVLLDLLFDGTTRRELLARQVSYGCDLAGLPRPSAIAASIQDRTKALHPVPPARGDA